MDASKLWEEVWKAFECHIVKQFGDRTSQDVLNRQVKKFLGEGAGPVTPDNSDIREMMVAATALYAAERKQSKRKSPKSEEGPIVLLEMDSKWYVMDGNTRIGVWANAARTEQRRAIVITPRPRT
jgi:hypothetical protein